MSQNAKFVPNADQARARDEIAKACKPGARHLLTGYAGSGKTTLVQALIRDFQGMQWRKGRNLRVVAAAPTHKAVQVLAGKLAAAKLNVETVTLHRLLALKPKKNADAVTFERDSREKPMETDVVICDECSMIGKDLLGHLYRETPRAFLLAVGDPAQLPPVGEGESGTFSIDSHSHLDTIVRQAAGNPIVAAADAIRRSQGGQADWTWLRNENDGRAGLFVPKADPQEWMRRAFTSEQFKADTNAVRYLCWTNARAAEVNTKVRQWIYGDALTDAPFMVGESAIAKGPIYEGETVVFNTSQEMIVDSIEPDRLAFQCEESTTNGNFTCWAKIIPAWRIMLNGGDRKSSVLVPSCYATYNQVMNKIKDEAKTFKGRWGDYHRLKSLMAELQPIYALTTHNSQGSTFTNAFIDISDIRKRERGNLLETQQLAYVAATRPTTKLILVGT